MPLDLDLTVTPQIRQKYQKGALLHFIYQIGIVLQLFTWGSIFLLQSAPQTGASTVHVTCGTHGSRGSSRVALLTRARLVASCHWARLVASLLQARPQAPRDQACPSPTPSNTLFLFPFSQQGMLFFLIKNPQCEEIL